MLDGIPLVELSIRTILGIGVLFLLTGRLVPWPFYKNKIDEAERWRLAYEAERQARQASDEQTSLLLEGVKTNRDIINALFRATQHLTDPKHDVPSSGGSSVASQ